MSECQERCKGRIFAVFDGMYGTIHRWVKKLAEWNRSLSEQDCFALIKSSFGLELPGVQSLMDLEMGFPDEFFSQVVQSETRRALDAIQDDDKVICWVSTGRSPHAGESMSARDLHGILKASKDASRLTAFTHSLKTLIFPSEAGTFHVWRECFSHGLSGVITAPFLSGWCSVLVRFSSLSTA